MTVLNWVLLLVGIAAEFSAAVVLMKRKVWTALIMLPVLMTFCGLSDLLNAVLLTHSWNGSHAYQIAYAVQQIVGAFLILLLSLQVCSVVLNLKYILILWSTVAFSGLTLVALKAMPLAADGLMAFVTISDVVVTIAVLICWLIPADRWPQVSGVSLPLVATAVIVPSLAHLLAGVVSTHLHLNWLLRYGFQAAGLSQVGFVLLALWRQPATASIAQS